MAEYRLYFMDRLGHIGRALDLDCHDDEHAIQVVKARRDVSALELWSGPKRVAVFPTPPIE